LPVKVSEMIRRIETDGWVLKRTKGEPSAVSAPGQARDGNDRRQAERHVAPADRGEHPEAGRARAETVVTGYVIIIEGDETAGFSSYAPDLPGVVAAAATYEECVALMREAVAFHLDGMREDSEPIPVPTTVGVETVTAA